MTKLGTQMLEVKKSLRIHRKNWVHPRLQALTPMIKMEREEKEEVKALQMVNQKLVR